jgi:hypothetical protein
MALTQKEREKRYEDLVHRQTNLVRGMLTPKSIATRIYPHLPSANEPKIPEQPKEKRDG